MIRLTTAAVVVSLLAGCSKPVETPVNHRPAPKADPAGPVEAKPAAFTLLGIEPGRTTLEEFRSRFKAGEPQDTSAKGVQTAEAGPEADLSADGLKVTRLKVAALDGVVFDVLVQVEREPSPEGWIGKKLGDAKRSDDGMLTWDAATIHVILFPETGRLSVADSKFGVEAFGRGRMETLDF